VSIVSIIRAIRRKLTPPGNRGSLESEYLQPNGPSDMSPGTEHNAPDMHGGGW